MCEIAQPVGIAKSYYVPSISLGPTVHFTDWLSDVTDLGFPFFNPNIASCANAR